MAMNQLSTVRHDDVKAVESFASESSSSDFPVRPVLNDKKSFGRTLQHVAGRSVECRSPREEKKEDNPSVHPSPYRRIPSHFEEGTPLASNRSFLSQKSDENDADNSTRSSRPSQRAISDGKPGNRTPILNEEAQIGESADVCASNKPQHLLLDDRSEVEYYRVVYRGVVSLLADPHAKSQRSGSYVSLGDIVASSWTTEATASPLPNLQPRQDGLQSPNTGNDAPSMPLLRHSGSEDQVDNHIFVVRVDRVLTGGYSIMSHSIPSRKGSSNASSARDRPPEYIVSHAGMQPVVEKLRYVPEMEEGSFMYKVVSSSPVPILAGPTFEAPRMSAAALPNSTCEVSLRVKVRDGNGRVATFLRLKHRKGWLADKRQDYSASTVKEVPVPVRQQPDDCDQSVVSSISTLTSVTSVSRPNRRHRPPRKRTDGTVEDVAKGLPRIQNVNLPASATPVKNASLPSGPLHKKLASPFSNLSLMSDESSMGRNSTEHPQSPDISYATNKSTGSTSSRSTSIHFLIKVIAPRGLKVLDAPQFQVNNLIHGNGDNLGTISSSQLGSHVDPGHPKGPHSIFHTMSGRTTAGLHVRSRNPAVFDSGSRTRVLPRGVLFEACKRMESTGAFSQGAGLIKLSDNSGWAIVPRPDDLADQYRSYQGLKSKDGEASKAFEEVGNSLVHETGRDDTRASLWLRVLPRSGLPISCPAPFLALQESDSSPSSSKEGSSVGGSQVMFGQESETASSVGSAFLDSMFRTPGKKKRSIDDGVGRISRVLSHSEQSSSSQMLDSVPCGMCVEVERWQKSHNPEEKQEHARLMGGQGWVPMVLGGKIVAQVIEKPNIEIGSFWFRVSAERGVKARVGPSKKAPSIRSDDGAHTMRFECGEFLRASEIVTIRAQNGATIEAFAKLFRNRHARLHNAEDSFRPLLALASPAEWVAVTCEDEVFLEECLSTPRIERHRQGWRYKVVPESGVAVRKGPSFASKTSGVVLKGGESVVVTERVAPGGEGIKWLRLRDGQWVHETDENGGSILIPHSLLHRSLTRPIKEASENEDAQSRQEAAYNQIVARLFRGGQDEGQDKAGKD